MKNSKITIFLGLIVFLGLANFFVWQEVFGLGRGLEVVFFDVGQGDAIWVESPLGHQILIDGGPSGERIIEKLSSRMPFWDRSLDAIILTHPDADHLRGLLDVLDRYKVENIIWTGVLRETKTFDKWIEKIEREEEEGANIFIARSGDVIRADSSAGREAADTGAGDVFLYILHPEQSMEGELAEQNSNDTSIVAKLVFGQNTFLFAGDISAKVEEGLLPRSNMPVGLGADVLKIAHHGSKNSSSKEFIGIVEPEIAVISCGKDNSYGHPRQEVLSNLQNFGIKVLRTDELGDISIKSNGISLFVN